MLVVDIVIAPGNAPDCGKLLDIRMLVIGGRERTKRGFAALYAAVGLCLTRVTHEKPCEHHRGASSLRSRAEALSIAKQITDALGA